MTVGYDWIYYYNMSFNQLSRLFKRLDAAKGIIDKYRPLPASTLNRLKEQLVVEWTYNSNAIEGNTMTLRETRMVLEVGVTISGKPLREHLEVINHKEAIEFVESLVQSKTPITERDLKDIHAIILRKVDDSYAGRYRDIQVRITGSKHTPPEALHLPQLMKEFVQTYLTNPTGHPVEQAALAHYHLVSIHPFVDGNGRTARLLMNLILLKHGFFPAIILKNDRRKYYNELEQAHAEKMDPFVFFVGRSLERTLALYLEAIPDLKTEMLSFAEAEKVSPYSRHYLGVMARRGVIPAFKLKRNWVIFKSDLEKYSGDKSGMA